tara:strand:- start:5127 stop:5432 length:306 start_codon:yes stop_codon:yes gene_type:complete
MIKTINRFDAAVNMVPKEGVSVLHLDVEDAPFYIQYDTQEELEKDFSVSIHPLYKSIHVEPKVIIKEWGESVDAAIKGGTQEVYLNVSCLYIIKNGKCLSK